MLAVNDDGVRAGIIGIAGAHHEGERRRALANVSMTIRLHSMEISYFGVKLFIG